MPTLVGQRVLGIVLGGEGPVNLDELRRDPHMGVVLGRLEVGRGRSASLAGKSTLHRVEHGAAMIDR